MARILGIGIATLDIVNVVDDYPPEDAKVRAISRHRARGGNAANTLAVLARLGHRCSLAATLAADAEHRYVLDDLAARDIDTSPCRIIEGAHTPTSYIVQNRRNGSRTIVHYRDLPEYPAAAFGRLDPGTWDWCHFEGRNAEETRAMLRHLRRCQTPPRCSMEIEKPRPGIESLFDHADVLLFGRDYVTAGHDDPESFLGTWHARLPGTDLVCAWGEDGAFAVDGAGRPCRSPAFPPPDVVDTLGAGDTFNAGIIDALSGGASLPEALDRACRLAGRKCGYRGLEFPADLEPAGQ